MIDVSKITIFNCPSPCCNDYEICLAVDPCKCYSRLEDFYKYKNKPIAKTGKEYLHMIPREKLESLIMNYCCPDSIGIETVLSIDDNFCSDDCMGYCKKCWESNVIKSE